MTKNQSFLLTSEIVVMSLSQKKTIVALYGAIASGKTSLFNLYRQKHEQEHDVVFLPEPIDKFQKWKAYEPLKLVENDPIRNASCVQLHIQSSLASLYGCMDKQLAVANTAICDSYLDSSSVYAEALMRCGYLTPFSRDYLLETMKETKTQNGWPEPTGIYFLDVPVEVCLERMKGRGRDGEQKFVTIGYLQHLIDCYREIKCKRPEIIWHESKKPSVPDLENFVRTCQLRTC